MKTLGYFGCLILSAAIALGADAPTKPPQPVTVDPVTWIIKGPMTPEQFSLANNLGGSGNINGFAANPSSNGSFVPGEWRSDLGLRDYNVRVYGAVGDGSANDTTAIQSAIAAAIAAGGGRVTFPAGTYSVTGLNIHGSKVALVGAGSGSTTIKRRSATASDNVVEFGVFADGNSAVATSGNALFGVTLDGNKAGTAQPANDLTGWGLAAVASSGLQVADVRAVNCWNGGAGITINSDYANISMTVESCGVEGNVAGGPVPGFDVNSSHYGHYTITSKSCYYGARFLDNCWGNVVDASVYGATLTGFIVDNQLSNESYGNTFRIMVLGGASAQGVSVGANVRASNFTIVLQGVTGKGVNEVAVAAPNTPAGNVYAVASKGGGTQAALVGGTQSIWTITSDRDGRTGAQGTSFAVDVYGDSNLFRVNLTDTATWQVRGIVFRSGADNNRVDSYAYTNTADPYSDLGANNLRPFIPDAGDAARVMLRAGTANGTSNFAVVPNNPSTAGTSLEVYLTDQAVDRTNYEALRIVGVVANQNYTIGSWKGGTGSYRDLLLQHLGGNVQIGHASSVTSILGTTSIANTGLRLLDTDASHLLIFAPGSNLTANRTLTITTGDANRTVTLSGDLTVSSTATVSGTNTGDQTSVTGNAGTATALQTARAINGVNFDGTAAITVTAAAGTLSGSTLASGVTASSLTSFGANPVLGAATATTASADDNDTSVATTAFVQGELTAYASDTATLTNKTFDASATGNVLKAKNYIYLTHPHLADGTGATIGTTASSLGYGHATFSNSADQAANYVEYYFQVPEDLDTSVALRARLKVRLGNTDTGAQRYVLSSVSVADSAVPTSSTLANAINVDFAGDASGASGDVETSAWTTLTSWAAALTAGQTWRVRLARDGDSGSDGSTVDSTELGLVLEYGVTQ